MKLYGKIMEVIPNDRIIRVLTKKKIITLYMSRKYFRDFGPYFYDKPYVLVHLEDGKKRYGSFMAYEILSFVKIIQFKGRKRQVFYDISLIQQGVRNLIYKKQNRLFLDLEFSLPSYQYPHTHIPEIVQYGIVLEDENGNLILEDQSLVKPLRKYALNKRTYQFIKKKKEDFDSAIDYIEFYLMLAKYIEEYDAKIIAWGKNDILTLEQSFKLNRLQALDVRNRYINLMQVIKNYYNVKNDLGLFDTYQAFTGIKQEKQSHDALEDAMIAREIFKIFKERIELDSE